MQRSHPLSLVSNHQYRQLYLLYILESLPSLHSPNPHYLPLPVRVSKSNFVQHLPLRPWFRSNCRFQLY